MLVDVGAVTTNGDLGIDADGRCTLNGQRITPDTAARLGLSGPVTTLLLDHRGLPLSVRRNCSRTATAARQLALLIRDGGCRWPGCPPPCRDPRPSHHRMGRRRRLISAESAVAVPLPSSTGAPWRLLGRARPRHRRGRDPPTRRHPRHRPRGRRPGRRATSHRGSGRRALAPGEAGTHLETDDIATIENLAHRHDHADQDEPDERGGMSLDSAGDVGAALPASSSASTTRRWVRPSAGTSTTTPSSATLTARGT